MTVDNIIEIITKGDRITALILILWAGYKGYWRFGYQFEELQRIHQRVLDLRDIELATSEQQRREWKTLAENLLGHAATAVAKVETTK